jgi:light-regulated signal transduction histidine kinase (bacteriophytochrome)
MTAYVGYALLLFLFPLTFILYAIYVQIVAKKQHVDDKMAAINESCFVAAFTSKGFLVDSNDKFNNFFTCKPVNLQHADLVFLEDFDRDQYYELWQKLLSGEQVTGTFRFKALDDSEKWAKCSYTPVRAKGGAVHKILLVGSDTTEDRKNRLELQRKNIYLEHAAKIIRHDMHSGICTYIPRGVKSIRRRLTEEDITKLRLDAPLKLLEEGLIHTQMVYKGVYEFTNLVKKNAEMSKEYTGLQDLLLDYLSRTSYSDQVVIGPLPTLEVNESLFCTAIDNLIRNGLKYNDSPSKVVTITTVGEDHLAIIDNGRGLTQKSFETLCSPYERKKGQKEPGSGLGLNITKAILTEHGFHMFIEEQERGTVVKIRIR